MDANVLCFENIPGVILEVCPYDDSFIKVFWKNNFWAFFKTENISCVIYLSNGVYDYVAVSEDRHEIELNYLEDIEGGKNILKWLDRIYIGEEYLKEK